MSTGGITDEAAIEGHDLIHNAELEEQRAHGDHALTQPDEGEEPLNATKQSETGMSSSGQQQQQQQQKQSHHHSTMDKVKEALHFKK